MRAPKKVAVIPPVVIVPPIPQVIPPAVIVPQIPQVIPPVVIANPGIPPVIPIRAPADGWQDFLATMNDPVSAAAQRSLKTVTGLIGTVTRPILSAELRSALMPIGVLVTNAAMSTRLMKLSEICSIGERAVLVRLLARPIDGEGNTVDLGTELGANEFSLSFLYGVLARFAAEFVCQELGEGDPAALVAMILNPARHKRVRELKHVALEAPTERRHEGQRPAKTGTGTRPFTGECNRCHKKGHKEADCWTKRKVKVESKADRKTDKIEKSDKKE